MHLTCIREGDFLLRVGWGLGSFARKGVGSLCKSHSVSAGRRRGVNSGYHLFSSAGRFDIFY